MSPLEVEECIFLTYPTAYSLSTNENGESMVFGVVENEKRPVVIILAWTSAIERHMRLYSKIYEDEGYITLISICPLTVSFWYHDELRKISQKILEILEDNNLMDRPMIIQLFSNGGAMQYEFLMKSLKANRKSLQIKGIIFDSAPGKTNFKNYHSAVHIMRGGTSETKSAIMIASLFTGWRIRNFIRYLSQREYFVWDSWQSLKDEENICPQHFIYSRGDPVTPFQDIEAFLEHRKLLGVKVTCTVYEKTPHIRHLQYEKLSYSISVLSFVKRCLNNSSVYELKNTGEILTSKL